MRKTIELLEQAVHCCWERVAPPGRPVNGLDMPRPGTDDIRRLVQQIFLLQKQERPQVVVFSAIDHGNGSSYICTIVAHALVKNVDGPICIVEANLRSPGLAEKHGTANHNGLTNALLKDGPIRSFMNPLTNHSNLLWLLSCGSLQADSVDRLNSERLKSRFDELRMQFDFILVDTPPLTRYADALALGQVADGFVVVLEADSTRKEAALRAMNNLRSARVPVLGAVLNKRAFPMPEYLYRRF